MSPRTSLVLLVLVLLMGCGSGDAIMGAANYLQASGAPASYARALHAYNPSRSYVDAVLSHARRMRQDRHAYFAYHSWQVFVHTPSGIRRLTGPGIGC
jgi:hypothetical protein